MLKHFLLCLCGFGLIFASGAIQASAADEKALPAATKAADNWLSLVDVGKYSESWTQTSSFFRDRVPQEAWAQQASVARDPLGALVSRKLANAHYTTSLPGAPDGRYVVLKYKSSFAHKKAAVETVTTVRDSNGTWRVSGYYIR
jgi:hypothetical protein